MDINVELAITWMQRLVVFMYVSGAYITYQLIRTTETLEDFPFPAWKRSCFCAFWPLLTILAIVHHVTYTREEDDDQ